MSRGDKASSIVVFGCLVATLCVQGEAKTINKDGKPEYFIPLDCGATGNCNWGIFAISVQICEHSLREYPRRLRSKRLQKGFP